MNYDEFLKSKSFLLESSGFDANEVDEHLYPFQRDIVKWAIRKGRAAIFADCGLGKTIMQLEWAHKVYLYTNKPVLILAPLAVCEQTKKEAYERLGLEVMVCESQDDVIDGINITNYEKIDKFVANSFSGVVLDESSILKSFTGKLVFAFTCGTTTQSRIRVGISKPSASSTYNKPCRTSTLVTTPPPTALRNLTVSPTLIICVLFFLTKS